MSALDREAAAYVCRGFTCRQPVTTEHWRRSRATASSLHVRHVSLRFNADQTRAAFTICHPQGNIVTTDMIGALRTGLDSIASNPHLKLITIEGEGPDFSFGASIPEHAPDRIGQMLAGMHPLIETLLEAPAVTVAIVRGRCLGGGFELALACDSDLRVRHRAARPSGECGSASSRRPVQRCCRLASAWRERRGRS